MADTISAEELAKLEAEVVKSKGEATIPSDATAETPSTATASTTETPAAAPVPVASEATPAPAAEPAAPPREREMVVDARLGVLRAMFPDFDDSLLQSVLDSVNGNTDRAIDALLGMSDPDYTSEAPPTQTQQAPQTQEELDEQLARTLMLEDERQHHAWRAQQPPPQQQRPEARRQTSTGAPERDTMQELQEGFNKLAESGKKTFGTLFSKVKAKIQEFDQPAGQSSNVYGAGGDTYPYDANQHPYPAARSEQQAQAQMPAYYDPNERATNTTPPSSATAGGYDAAPPASMTASGAPIPPPTTNTGAPQIDGGKLGMLPKRPVSLLRTNSPPTGGAPPSSDDDELEYAENPFEEGKK